ncbi:MAG: hypothetical protein KDA45_01780 [Planctomycetales bacterium]|nr:hypothetical protein [Planctomycetales bacterium]
MSHSHRPVTARLRPLMERTLIIGLGSPHGNDRVGWDAIDLLDEEFAEEETIACYKAAVPHDILDWLDNATPTHLIDACSGPQAAGLRLEITRDALGGLQALCSDADGTCHEVVFPKLRSTSSHQFDLQSTLELASALDTLPRRLILWTIPIPSAIVEGKVQPEVEQLTSACVQRLALELRGG